MVDEPRGCAYLKPDTKIYALVSGVLRRIIYLPNVDEDARAAVLVPVSTVTAVMIVLVVMVLPIIKTILVLVPLMSTPIIRPQLTDSSHHKGGKENCDCEQHFAVMPQRYIFHRSYSKRFHESL